MTDTILGSIPSPMHIRDELETMLLNDLLGPVSGPEEEIDEHERPGPLSRRDAGPEASGTLARRI